MEVQVKIVKPLKSLVDTEAKYCYETDIFRLSFISNLLDYRSNDTLFKIELFPSIVLSSRATNWKNDIHKFL